MQSAGSPTTPPSPDRGSRDRRRYRKPTITSETTYETKAMACAKVGSANTQSSCHAPSSSTGFFS